MTVEKFKQSVFDAIQIDNVIWVDDRFSPHNHSIVREYIAHVESVAESAPDKLRDFALFNGYGIDTDHPFETWKDLIPTDDGAIAAYYQYLEEDKPDFTTTEFNELISIFDQHSSGTINRLSLAEWKAQKATWLSTNSRNLFLIDYNFEHESESSTYGKDIVEDILNQKNLSDIYCVLFTSEAQHGKEEEEKRNKIIREMSPDINSYNFSVLSKSIITSSDDEGVCIHFKASEFVKRIFLRKLSADMVDSISDGLIESIRELKNDLSQHSIYEVDHSIFTNSLSEGASEFELLHRLFSIKQHQSLNELLLKSDLLAKKLCKFRSVQSVAYENKAHKEYIERIIPVNNKFANLRLEEIFDKAINSIHSPLSSGDIFDFDGKLYILIEQACDLSVRGLDGKRKLTEAILIPFEEREIKNNSTKEQVSFSKKQALDKFHLLKIPNTTSKNYYCLFDFSEAVTVNINWLDLCVFNKCGSLKLEYNAEPAELVHLPGWRLKHYNIVKKMAPVVPRSYYQALTYSSIKENSDFDALKNDFGVFSLIVKPCFNYFVSPYLLIMSGKRIKRLRHNFMESLSRAYFVGYKSRGALENDFSL